MEQMKSLKFSPAQIQFLAQLNSQKQAAPEVVELKEIEEQAATPTPPAKQNLISEEPVEVQADKQETAGDEKAESDKPAAPSKKKATPIDQVEKDQQPADNDDDEKLADNHRKQAKIDLKKEEIRKLEETH